MNDLGRICSAATVAASLAQVLIDYQIGIYGRSSAVMHPLQTGNLLCTSLVYAWWALVSTEAAARDDWYVWSDPSPLARTPRNVATELHTLLQNAGIRGPYVLVGASLGGKYIRMYA